MSLINYLTPIYYRVLRMGIQRDDGVSATYDIAILNADGHQLDTLALSSAFTPQEKAAVAAIFLRDQTQFEANTGLAEWEE